jgi:hypothetical protein
MRVPQGHPHPLAVVGRHATREHLTTPSRQKRHSSKEHHPCRMALLNFRTILEARWR